MHARVHVSQIVAGFQINPSIDGRIAQINDSIWWGMVIFSMRTRSLSDVSNAPVITRRKAGQPGAAHALGLSGRRGRGGSPGVKMPLQQIFACAIILHKKARATLVD